MLIEQGKRVEKRKCPENECGKCVKCKPFCNITCGFSGAGAFSDGKLSLYNKDDDDFYVGGNLHKYVGIDETKKLIDYTDNIYLKFGATIELEGINHQSKITKIRKKAENNRLELINIPIRHLGTDKSHDLYQKIEEYLENFGVTMLFESEVVDLIIHDNKIEGVKYKKEGQTYNAFCSTVILAVGRVGANWMLEMCSKHQVKTAPGPIDIGIRYELPDKVMEDIKSSNTNLALLVSLNIKDVNPMAYARNIVKNMNALSKGNIIVQRLVDLKSGKRTWDEEIKSNSVEPTLKSALAGDIGLAMPYRVLTDILGFIEQMDKVVPGFANLDNLLYGPEVKFYSNKVELSKEFQTSVQGLYAIGDGCGLTRGLMMASASGVQLARVLCELD